MTDTTHAYALLLRVMGVAGEDARLPLPVLVNMHRRQLRAPLENLLHTHGTAVPTPAEGAKLTLARADRLWPDLAGGRIFEKDLELETLVLEMPHSYQLTTQQMLDGARDPEPLVVELLKVAWDGWVVCEPLVLLHELTHASVEASRMHSLIKILAHEMALSTDVEAMIEATMVGQRP